MQSRILRFLFFLLIFRSHTHLALGANDASILVPGYTQFFERLYNYLLTPQGSAFAGTHSPAQIISLIMSTNFQNAKKSPTQENFYSIISNSNPALENLEKIQLSLGIPSSFLLKQNPEALTIAKNQFLNAFIDQAFSNGALSEDDLGDLWTSTRWAIGESGLNNELPEDHPLKKIINKQVKLASKPEDVASLVGLRLAEVQAFHRKNSLNFGEMYPVVVSELQSVMSSNPKLPPVEDLMAMSFSNEMELVKKFRSEGKGVASPPNHATMLRSDLRGVNPNVDPSIAIHYAEYAMDTWQSALKRGGTNAITAFNSLKNSGLPLDRIASFSNNPIHVPLLVNNQGTLYYFPKDLEVYLNNVRDNKVSDMPIYWQEANSEIKFPYVKGPKNFQFPPPVIDQIKQSRNFREALAIANSHLTALHVDSEGGHRGAFLKNLFSGNISHPEKSLFDSHCEGRLAFLARSLGKK